MRVRALRHATVAGLAATLVAAGTAGAVIGLPQDGTQVNDDIANGIDPAQDAGVSDVVGGSLAAGGARVPWSTFEQRAGSAQRIFVRAFKNGRWVTQGPVAQHRSGRRGRGAVDRLRRRRPDRPVGRLVRAERGARRREPDLREPLHRRREQVAARGPGPWRGVPSLNINTDKEAENPSVAGGAAVAGADPVPWVAWEEEDGNVAGSGNHDQIFVSKGVKQAAPNQPCTGFKPSAAASVSSFCWQQVGLDRLAKDGGSSATGDPTLNIDPSRNGVEPDIAFTGANDTVAWVVWYEKEDSAIGLRNNEQVFAARIVKDDDRGRRLQLARRRRGTAGQNNILDTTGAKGFGACAGSTARRGRVLAQRRSVERRGGSARRGRHADARDPDRAVGRVLRGRRRRAPWGVPVAARRR